METCIVIPGQKEPEVMERYTCPYCLKLFETAAKKEIQCPLCEHHLHPELLSTPVHEYDENQKTAWALNECTYISFYRAVLLRSFKKLTGGGLGSEYAEEKKLQNRLGEAVDWIKDNVPEGDKNIFERILTALDSLEGDKGGLAQFLAERRKLMEKAVEVSREDPDEIRLLEFQLEFMQETSWGAIYKKEEKLKKMREDLVELKGGGSAL